jgi:hypothetical protein
MKCLIEKNIKINDLIIYLVLFQLHKSYLLLISDQKNMGIGNVTLGSPPIIEGSKSIIASHNLFGLDSRLLSTIIAEKSSQVLKAPVLLLYFIKRKIEEEKLAKGLLKFLNRVLSDINKK